jgi:hypothetical protein
MTIPRGTTNKNARGSSSDRRRRREWLVEHYRANTNANVHLVESGTLVVVPADCHGTYSDDVEVTKDVPACRCYRCGCLLTVDTVTVDRIIPGCQGGTYRRDNIRPACGHCNSEVGGALRSTAKRTVAVA